MPKNKQIHFVGIKGVGMTPLAIIAKEAGFAVSGCDIEREFITDEILKKAKISPLVGFSKEHLRGKDLIITTGAHGGFSNEEILEAKKLNIPVWSQGQAIGEFMKGDIFKRKFKGISIAGSHGKTTTTGMIATILKEANLDPSYLIGTSSLPSLEYPGHYGKGEYFVAEADEYVIDPVSDRTPKFLCQQPEIAVFTNIEFDHPDIYESLEEVKIAFLKFANQLGQKSLLIANGDDKQIQEILKNYSGNKITFGFSSDNDYVLKRLGIRDTQTFFWVDSRKSSLGEFTIQVGGEHNAFNALAAIATCLEIGLSKEAVRKGLLHFKGSKRRFEYLGKTTRGALIYDDYAHHPTEIKKSLEAIRQMYPKFKLICIFQPHTYSRTKKLFEQFSDSFTSANQVIFMDIYSSLREKDDPSVSSSKLTQSTNEKSGNAIFLPQPQDVIEYVEQKRFGGDTIIVTMGAGDVYETGYKLVKI